MQSLPGVRVFIVGLWVAGLFALWKGEALPRWGYLASVIDARVAWAARLEDTKVPRDCVNLTVTV